ncbi:MAG: Lrp/AsnC family transcriptional regulator [Candidatus Woesearchaeota archaeon]
MLNEKLGIDDKDQKIISMLEADSNSSQSEIAETVGLSQPSVGMRIHKLKQKGIISTIIGMNFRKVNLFLAKVDVTTTDTEKVIKSFDKCAFFLNGLIVSGTENLCLFFMSPDLVTLEGVINYHLRAHPNVTGVKMEIVINPVKDFVFPVNLCEQSIRDKKEFKEKCHNCPYRTTLYSESQAEKR